MTSAIQEKNQWGVFPRMGTLGLHDQQSYDYMSIVPYEASTEQWQNFNKY